MAPDPSGPQCIAGADERSARTTSTRSRRSRPATRSARACRSTGCSATAGTRPRRTFVQIPFQVDELAVRYLSNNASGFSVYSWSDQHPTYVFDEERFRWTERGSRRPVPRGAPRRRHVDARSGARARHRRRGRVHGERRRARRAGRRSGARRADRSQARRHHRPVEPRGRTDLRVRRPRRGGRAAPSVHRGQRLRAVRARRRQRHVPVLRVELRGLRQHLQGRVVRPGDRDVRDRRPAPAPPEGHGVGAYAALRVPVRRPLAHDRAAGQRVRSRHPRRRAVERTAPT